MLAMRGLARYRSHAAVLLGLLLALAGCAVAMSRDGWQLAAIAALLTLLAATAVLRDLDMDRKRRTAIAEAETRWNFALASAGQGVWSLDMRAGGTTYSATWVEMLGYDEGELDGDPERWLTMIHPDDLGGVEAADRAHASGKTEYFEAEFRMRRKDGSWIWILDRGKALERAGDGTLIRAIGSLTDITSRKEAEQRAAEESERLRVTLNSIGDAVICTDAAGRITFMNPVAETLTGVAGTEALGRPVDRIYRPVDEETGVRLPLAADQGAGEQNSRAALVRRDRTRCSIRQVVSPIVGADDQPSGSVIVFQDFTDARTLQRELAYAAAHDALTGLTNRAALLRAAEALAVGARRGDGDHQFLFVDLDRFKAVNDTAGHVAGDALLKAVAAAIRAAVRPDDVVARLGGDEFAVIVKSCTPAVALRIANALVDAVAGIDFVWEGQRFAVGASVGIAPVDRGCGPVDAVIARADEACYRAKAAGRGRAVAAVGEQARRAVSS